MNLEQSPQFGLLSHAYELAAEYVAVERGRLAAAVASATPQPIKRDDLELWVKAHDELHRIAGEIASILNAAVR